MSDVRYLRLHPGEAPPEVAVGPFRAVLIVDLSVDAVWQEDVCHWLIRSGCLYFVAWGVDCEDWHDSVDHAVLSAFDYSDIPDDDFVMTTWHDNEPLAEALWFAKCCAYHPTVDLIHTLLLHIGPDDRSAELLAAYEVVDVEED